MPFFSVINTHTFIGPAVINTHLYSPAIWVGANGKRGLCLVPFVPFVDENCLVDCLVP
jgi:hypothetical protein